MSCSGRLALVGHPDKNPTDQQAATFKQAQAADEVLSNEHGKKLYDDRIKLLSKLQSKGGRHGGSESETATSTGVPTKVCMEAATDVRHD